MLKELNISNLAVIDKENLKVNKGFSVLTGETGAGKSVLIDSVNMILGHRGDKGLVRYGKKSAVAEAVFFSRSEHILNMLEQQGVFDCGEEIRISRSLSSDGRSACKINGVLTTAAFLKQLGAELINIHGQQDNQKLLMKKYHTEILDVYIAANGDGEVICEYKKAYEAYNSAKKRFDTAVHYRHELENEIKYLQFVSEELFNADIKKGEEKELEEKQEILANAMDIYMALSMIYDCLYDGETNVYEMLSASVNAAGKISSYSEKLKEFKTTLEDLMYQVKDVASEVCDFRDSNEPDDGELKRVDERLGLIFDLKRKYKKSADELKDYAEEVDRKLQEFEAEDIDELRIKLEEAEKEVKTKGECLRRKREFYKKILEDNIHAALSDLNMKHAKFEIFLKETQLSQQGTESAEFMMCTAGQGEMQPMEKIASGGELSRIMLAIKYVLSDCDDCETLIFDEIDTGVSGVSAAAVAEKLYALSKKKQVICITHLAQIAAMADFHILISKEADEDGVFFTNVTELDEAGRIAEISRIMAGDAVSGGVNAAARELILAAEEKKKSIVS